MCPNENFFFLIHDNISKPCYADQYIFVTTTTTATFIFNLNLLLHLFNRSKTYLKFIIIFNEIYIIHG